MFNLFKKKQVITTFENSKEKYIEIKNVGLISSEIIETKHIRKIPTTRNKDFEVNNLIEKVLNDSHILVAGCTGAGKSVTMNYLIASAASINNCELMLIDNKNTSFKWCKNLPIVKQYASNIQECYILLLEALNIITSRYASIENDPFCEEYKGKHLYIIIDELADLLTVDKKKFLPILQRIAQIGRGAKVHLIAGSQVCTKDILGTLKNNFTCKIGLRCMNSSDSKMIINDSCLVGLPIGYSIIQFKGENLQAKIHYTTIEEKKQILDFFNVEY